MAKRYQDGKYEGMDSRRDQEREDGGMIREDRSAMANLPQNVIMRPWVGREATLPESLNDTISGVDSQINGDNAKRRSGFAPKKV